MIGCLLSLLFRWFNFEKVIEALVAKNVYHMSLEQLQTYAKEVCFIEDEDQFNTMLSFYHSLGMIVKHRSTVILKAKWLIDLFKQLITIPSFDKVVRKRDVSINKLSSTDLRGIMATMLSLQLLCGQNVKIPRDPTCFIIINIHTLLSTPPRGFSEIIKLN